jgi:hypothetical protein
MTWLNRYPSLAAWQQRPGEALLDGPEDGEDDDDDVALVEDGTCTVFGTQVAVFRVVRGALARQVGEGT